MQKLEERHTNTPTDASQVCSNCDSVIKHGHSDQVLQNLKTSSNNSDVNLPVLCGSGMDVDTIHRKNHTPIPPPIEIGGLLGGKIMKGEGKTGEGEAKKSKPSFPHYDFKLFCV